MFGPGCLGRAGVGAVGVVVIVYKVSVSDGFTDAELKFSSLSGYFSVCDIFAIIEANTDLRRVLPKKLKKKRKRNKPADPTQPREDKKQ
jgi:hypothetical protein